MADSSLTTSGVPAVGSVATFEWRNLHLHVVTREPLPADHVRTMGRVLPKISSVGMFADALGTVLGRHVRIRTERPSPNIWFEVGR